MTAKQDELERKLLDDGTFQHILKFAPASQRELMTFELARYFNTAINSEVLAVLDELDELTGVCDGHCNLEVRTIKERYM